MYEKEVMFLPLLNCIFKSLFGVFQRFCLWDNFFFHYHFDHDINHKPFFHNKTKILRIAECWSFVEYEGWKFSGKLYEIYLTLTEDFFPLMQQFFCQANTI